MNQAEGQAPRSSSGDRFAHHMEAVARRLLGEPNKKLSGPTELRFGTHGSLVVDLDKGTWFSHEDDKGGGVLDLIARETGLINGAAVAWMRDELGIVLDDRPPPRAKRGKRCAKVTAYYVYRDEQGEPLYRVLRRQPKDFSQQRYDNGKWIGGKGVLNGVRRVLYRLPELLAADPAEPVFLTEGEKDADRLRGLGLVATTSAQGAAHWNKTDSAALTGRHVVVLPDNDAAGSRYERAITADLASRAGSLRVLRLPNLPPQGDVSDWLDAGGTVEELRQLAAETPHYQPTVDWRAIVHRTSTDQIRDIAANMAMILRYDPAFIGRLRWNELLEAAEARDLPWRPGSGWKAWTDLDDIRLTEWAQNQSVFVRQMTCTAAVQVVAAETRHHPVREYLSSLAWDGTPRLDNWLSSYLGAASGDPYLRAVGRKWMISAAARAFKPGCKADHALIFEGPQGRRKSSAAATLAVQSDWFSDEIADLGTKDSAQDLRGKWVIEIAELAAMRRGEIERMKAFISRKTDHYRPSYGRRSEDFPRQCVFIGSTNADTYLADETGGRRFWPVKVGTIDIDALRHDRDQLWAEAVHAYRAGENWWLDATTEQLARAEQEDRRQQDPWERTVMDWCETRTDVSIPDILAQPLDIPKAQQDQAAMNRVARILRANGWERFRKRPRGGKPEWRYRPETASHTGNNGPGVGTSGNKNPSKSGHVPTVPSMLEMDRSGGSTNTHHVNTESYSLCGDGGSTGNTGNGQQIHGFSVPTCVGGSGNSDAQAREQAPAWDDDREWSPRFLDKTPEQQRALLREWIEATGGRLRDVGGTLIAELPELRTCLASKELHRRCRELKAVVRQMGHDWLCYRMTAPSC